MHRSEETQLEEEKKTKDDKHEIVIKKKQKTIKRPLLSSERQHGEVTALGLEKLRPGCC